MWGYLKSNRKAVGLVNDDVAGADEQSLGAWGYGAAVFNRRMQWTALKKRRPIFDSNAQLTMM